MSVTTLDLNDLDLNDEVLGEAMRLSGLSAEDTINKALRQYTAHHRRIEALEKNTGR
jgi:Arc/MetJ family transcription regulator